MELHMNSVKLMQSTVERGKTMRYDIDIFIPSRQPRKQIDRFVDMLETVGNEVTDRPYPYEISLLTECEKLVTLAEDARFEAVLTENGRAIKKLIKTGVQALKIAHILNEFRIQQENESDE